MYVFTVFYLLYPVATCAHVKDFWQWLESRYKSIRSPLLLLRWQFPGDYPDPSSLKSPPSPAAIQTYGPSNWFSRARRSPHQADCQHGRWEALRGTLLLQQIWWIQHKLYHPLPCRRAEEGSVFVEESFSLTLCNTVSHRTAYWIWYFNLRRLVFVSSHLYRSLRLRLSWYVDKDPHNVYCGEERAAL